MARHVTVSVALVALIVLGAVALSLPATPVFARAPGGPAQTQNDAGSGEDAGDVPDLALLVAGGRRSWSANLTPTGTDADWYRLDSTGAFCAVLDSTTNSPGQATLTSSATQEAAVWRDTDPHATTRLALAAPPGRTPYFGLEPPLMSSSMWVEGDRGNPPSPGRYTFTLSSASYEVLDPEVDGETPEAGSTLATAAPLPADCSAGRLGGFDGEDRYYVDVTDPRELTVSFAIASGAAAHARIVDPSGSVVATLASGDVADVWAGTAGRWHVTITLDAPGGAPIPLGGLLRAPLAAPADTATTYLIGITDGPGEPQPCRPTCHR